MVGLVPRRRREDYHVELALGESVVDLVEWADRYALHVLAAEGVTVPDSTIPTPTRLSA